MTRQKLDLLFTGLHVPLDFILIILAGITGYKVRFFEAVTDIRPAIYSISFADFVKTMVYIAILIVAILAISGIYRVKDKETSFFEQVIKLFDTVSFAAMFIVVFIFFKREYFSSRFIILAGYGFTIIYLIIERIILRYIRHYFYKKGIGVSNIILIGSGRNFDVIKETISNDYRMGYKILDTASSFEEFENIYNTKYKGIVDEVINTDIKNYDDINKFIKFCGENHIVFKYVADIFDSNFANIKTDTLAGIPIIEIKKTKLDGWGRIIKRLFDICVSIFFIILFSPLMLIIAILIKIDSKGPIIYKNQRVGQNGKLFNTLKFRSMYYNMSTGVGDAEQQKQALEIEKKLIEEKNTRAGAIYKIKDDPRVTRVGHFIRKTSLDELPQFFNALIGNMSIVGPRPHQEREVANYKKEHLRVLDVKPGITGLAQVSGRSDLSYEEELRLDLYYVDNWSFLTDLRIALKTPFAAIGKRKAE